MNSKIIFLGIIIAGLIIGGSIIYSDKEKDLSDDKGLSDDKDIEERIDPGDHIKGNPEASITIVEFSDFECPYCVRFSQTMNQIIREYPSDVRWAYRHFPLSSHLEARPAAEASECAAEQNKFWEFHDGLFENQEGLGNILYFELAKNLELDVEQFQYCFSSRKYKDKVESDYQAGIQNGVKGTPGNFINGTPLGGALPYERLKKMVDLLLKSNN